MAEIGSDSEVDVSMDVPLVNVLTRTSGRPKFFYCNWVSIQQQDYPRVRHLVSYDDQETWEYLQEYVGRGRCGGVEAIEVERIPLEGGDHFPYNLYMNRLQAEIEEGWVMFLDDDDIFLLRGRY